MSSYTKNLIKFCGLLNETQEELNPYLEGTEYSGTQLFNTVYAELMKCVSIDKEIENLTKSDKTIFELLYKYFNKELSLESSVEELQQHYNTRYEVNSNEPTKYLTHLSALEKLKDIHLRMCAQFDWDPDDKDDMIYDRINSLDLLFALDLDIYDETEDEVVEGNFFYDTHFNKFLDGELKAMDFLRKVTIHYNK